MKVNDAIIGAVLVMFAIAEIAYTRTFPSLHGQSYGPNLFPGLIGLALAGCGIILIVRGLAARRTRNTGVEGPTANWFDVSNISESGHARTNALLVIAFLLAYIFLSDWVGFIPLSLATVSYLLYRLGSSIGTACIVAIVTTAVIQLLFARVLLVPLPAGLLQGMVW